MPQRIYGRKAAGKPLQKETKKGAGRALAELENSKSPDSAPKDLRTQGGRKAFVRRSEKGYWEGACGTGIGGTNEHPFLSCENIDHGRGQAHI